MGSEISVIGKIVGQMNKRIVMALRYQRTNGMIREGWRQMERWGEGLTGKATLQTARET